MYNQVRSLLSYSVRQNDVKRRIVKNSPIFMVCAAPSSGKATLMEIIGDLGEVDGNIQITRKYAQRSPRDATDGRDGMIAIGTNGKFEEHISLEQIWKWEFHKRADKPGTWYAVDRSEIEKNIQPGKAQIFVSNMGQIERAREFYPDNIVVLYLHATHETETMNHIRVKCSNDIVESIMKKNKCSIKEAEQIMISDAQVKADLDAQIEEKRQEIISVHNAYIEHIHHIDHVLLNTGTKEDLVEQMRNLIAYYTQQ